MSIKLFEHNEQAYRAAVKMLGETGKACVIHPTGTGKSFISFKLCEDNPGKTVWWLSPSDYIFKTQVENLAGVSDGWKPENIKFFTYAKLMLMSDDEINEIAPDFVILDEFHRCGAQVWGEGVERLLKAYEGIPVLGLSATAIRYLDNQRNMADELFDGNIASEITLGEAIVRGILKPPKYILSVYSYQNDLEKYEKRVRNAKNKAVRDKAEKYLEELRRALENADGLDKIFDKHMTDRHGKYIIFTPNYESMLEYMGKVKEWFGRIDGDPHVYSVYSDDPAASREFDDFKVDGSEHLKLLFCIDALNEGIHAPDISGVILMRPTISPIIFKQQIGRALSTGGSGTPVIFDIVNNIENLYSIDSVKEEMLAAVTYYRTHGEDKIVSDSFELIDRAADCKALFDELDGVLSAVWDTMYEKLVLYKKMYGNIDVSNRYYTEDAYSLGRWLETQRRVYKGQTAGTLTQEQIDKLNALGMRWESVSVILWNRHFAAAKAYFEENGDLLVPKNYTDDDGFMLGAWIHQIRSCRKSGIRASLLTDERIKALDGIGMKWDIRPYFRAVFPRGGGVLPRARRS